MRPLDGITVLDLTRVLSGPYCTMLLGDMGARVIKIEQPGRGDDTRGWGPPFLNGESAYFLSINRNKESVTLDFKKTEGRELLERLVAKSDVLVENFRPGTLEKIGFDYAALKSRYPRLIYCSISGFGQTGPRRNEPGYDAVVQAEGGLMSITGATDGPPFRLGVAIADIVSGMFAAYGVSLSLIARERSGLGQQVDLGMLDAVTALLTYQAGNYFASGKPPGRMGNRHPSIVPYETFEASDGEFVVAVGNDELWKKFCAATGLDAVEGMERFATNRQRVTDYEALRPLIADRLRSRPRAYWIETLSGAGIPCGSVRNLNEVFEDPQLRARGMLASIEHQAIGMLTLTGIPVKLSETPGEVRRAPPRLGEHTDAVLRDELAVDDGTLARLRERGVI
jgi:crotonobetainyl-CoA:carnitine CoA-transferase CaiB-like acyl-CoA transferase